MIERIDASISLWGQDNTKSLSQIDPQRQAAASQARKHLTARFLELRGQRRTALGGIPIPLPCGSPGRPDVAGSLRGVRIPSRPFAPPRSGGGVAEISRQQQRVVDYLNNRQEVRFTTPQGTDLKVVVAGRTWINCDGHENFPDGEVFTGPVEDATEGAVCYSFPAVHGGREVDEIRLSFHEGRVVDARAAKGEAFLARNARPGFRERGRWAKSPSAPTMQSANSREIPCSTKIGGTFHAAVGAAYPETGGKNQSGLHWDMVCDLRQGGKIFADGQLISENGVFLDPAWPQPSPR